MWCAGTFERVIEMNDLGLLYLKFQRRLSTQQLLIRFPRLRKRIVEVALLEVNARRLQKLLHEKRVWSRLRVLKKKYRALCQSTEVDREAVLVCRERHN